MGSVLLKHVRFSFVCVRTMLLIVICHERAGNATVFPSGIHCRILVEQDSLRGESLDVDAYW